MSAAENAFRKCGTVPFNPEIFDETDFLPSIVPHEQVSRTDLPSETSLLNELESKGSVRLNDPQLVFESTLQNVLCPISTTRRRKKFYMKVNALQQFYVGRDS